jgi:hypothetical protein
MLEFMKDFEGSREGGNHACAIGLKKEPVSLQAPSARRIQGLDVHREPRDQESELTMRAVPGQTLAVSIVPRPVRERSPG